MTTTALRPPVPVARRVWAETWRLVAVALVGLFAFATVWSTTDVDAMSEARLGAHLLVDFAVGVVALVLVPFRRRAPLLVGVLVIAGSAVSTLAVGAATLAIVSLAARRRPVEIAVGSGVFVLSSVLGEGLYSVDDTTPLWQIVVAAVVVIALLVAIGVGIGQRRALLDGLRERAALLERDQQLREDRAREQERAHLAREMHDVLGHRLSLVALHAGALEYRGRSLSPDETVEAAAVVRAEAHAALTELRDVLGVLRDPAEAPTGTAPPQPTLRDLPALLDEARTSGAAVTSAVDDRTATVPDAIGRHAYRIVQEALTNARRHAPGRPVDVRLVVVAGPALHVRVANPVAGPLDDPAARSAARSRPCRRRRSRWRPRPPRARRTRPTRRRQLPRGPRRHRTGPLRGRGGAPVDRVTAPVRVVLVDDDHLVRAGLRLLLSGDDDIEVVGEAGDGLDAEGVIADTVPDVVLMDIRMPRCDGLVATERELRRRPDLAVLVLTTFQDDDLVLGALQRGARGFLLKDTPPRELVDAVRAVAEGRSILSPSVLDRVIAFAAGPGSASAAGSATGSSAGADGVAERRLLDTLTDREREVALAVASGASNAQIAADLFVSLATVKTHVGHVYEKFGVENRVQLALVVHAATR